MTNIQSALHTASQLYYGIDMHIVFPNKLRIYKYSWQ